GQPIPPAPTAKSVPTPAGLLNAFKRRWVLATFVGLLTAVAISAAVWLALPGGKHEARGLIDLRDTTYELNSKNAENYEDYRKKQIFILKTRDLLNRTVNDPAVASLEMIKSSDDPVRILEEYITVTAAAPSILAVTMKGNYMDDMRVVIDSLMKRYVDDATKSDRIERAEQIRKLEKYLHEEQDRVDGEKRALQRVVSASGATGGDTGVLTSELLLTRMLELERMITTQTDEITKLESKLKVIEAQLGSFKVTDKTLEKLRSDGFPDTMYDKLKTIKDKEFRNRRSFVDELNKMFAKEELDHWRSIVTSSQIPDTQRPDIPEGEVIRAINNDVRIVKLVQEHTELTGIYNRESANATDPETAPAVQNAKERMEKKKAEIEAKKTLIRNDIIESVKSITLLGLQTKVATLEDDIAIAKETRDRYKQDHDVLRASRSSMAVSNIDVYQRLKEIEVEQQHLAQVRQKINEHQAQKQLDNRARIREDAQALPNNNLNKKIFMSSGLGVATFFLVLLIVAFLEWRTRRVDGVDQVVNELGMRIIGTVPVFPNRANLKTAAEVGGANWRFALNESINSTRTMLLHTARSQSMQVVMVTSATQGEGKTSLSSQLATSMATAGMRTLIVDCDLRNPSIHKLFDLGLSAGVSEILTQDADPSEAIQPTSIPNLWVIPAGQCSNRVIAALAQGHPLETLFNRLRGQFDFVIVDSCPVLPVADALLIGQHVDGVLFSIMQDISQIPKVVLASEKLNQLNIPLLGAVVNGIKQDVYSYGYNYVKQLPA
ncbi:MAG TPA: polysaccharide biosynthesis tyrosine autokinase, partial [Gemmata sp.]|nr:polysaccharide biosynthesis tyrosine autokinase [Gemmata sp.]